MPSGSRRPPSVVRTAYSNITEEYSFQTKKLQFINLHPNPLNISCIFQISKKTTNNQGGWCKETSQENSTEHATDKTLIPQLSKLLSDKTVLSFGDGPGAYQGEIEKLGHVKFTVCRTVRKRDMEESGSWILPFRNMVFDNMIG